MSSFYRGGSERLVEIKSLSYFCLQNRALTHYFGAPGTCEIEK